MSGTADQFQRRGILQNTDSVFKALKVMKNKESLRNCQRHWEPKDMMTKYRAAWRGPCALHTTNSLSIMKNPIEDS
jgi:hypothetical protein